MHGMRASFYTASFLLIALPWLSPLAPGPSPSVVPLLLSWFCFLVLIAGFLFLQLKVSAETSTRFWVAQHAVQIAAAAWVAAGAISAVIGLVQYAGLSHLAEPFINSSAIGTAFANLRQRNQFASLTNIGLVALIYMATRCVDRPKLTSTSTSTSTSKSTSTSTSTPPVASLFFISLAGLLMLGNAAASSRTGMVQLGLLVLLYALWQGLRERAVRSILLAAVLFYAGAVYFLPLSVGLEPFSQGLPARLGLDEGCSSRLVLWSNVITLIAQKPWLGWGWGELDYAHFSTLYSGPRFCDILDNAHNLPLHLAVELGVPNALLICGGFAWWVLRQKPWAERDATRQMAWAVVAIILLHSMLEYPLWYGPFQMAFVLCVGLLRRRKPPIQPLASPKNTFNWPLGQVLRVPAAMCLIAFIGYAAWDYHRISQIYLEPESRSAAYRTDTLNKVRSSWLFADQVQFAELLTTPLAPANAAWTLNMAKHLLHYSPEPRVIEKAIESAVMLGQDDDALAYLARYRAAFPNEHALWAKANAKQL